MTYRGDTLDGLRHGNGTYSYPNPFFSYTGQWERGIKHGTGRLEFADGGYIEGEFQQGEITGHGIRKWASGAEYTGDFVEGERHGSGIQTDPSGDSYTGEWVNNKRHGQGEQLLANGDIFVGVFANHAREGKGKIQYANGDVFEGSFVKNEICGQGCMTWAYGGRYEGECKAGKRQGTGSFDGGANGIQYTGEWHDDQPVAVASRLAVSVAPITYPEGFDPTDPSLPDTSGKGKKKKKGKAEPLPGDDLLPPDAPVIVAGSRLPELTVRGVYCPAKLNELREQVLAEREAKAAAAEEAAASKKGKKKGKGEEEEEPSEIDIAPFEGGEPWEAIAEAESGRMIAVTLKLVVPAEEEDAAADGESAEDNAEQGLAALIRLPAPTSPAGAEEAEADEEASPTDEATGDAGSKAASRKSSKASKDSGTAKAAAAATEEEDTDAGMTVEEFLVDTAERTEDEGESRPAEWTIDTASEAGLAVLRHIAVGREAKPGVYELRVEDVTVSPGIGEVLPAAVKLCRVIAWPTE